MSNFVLGIDVSKATLDVALYSGDETYLSGQFENSKDGLRRLFNFLKKQKARGCPVVLEATGRYGDLVAQKAHERACPVYVINPARIKAYAQSQLKRAKTDSLDAKVIAHFGSTQTMTRWEPPTATQVELQAMTRHLEALKQARTQEMNRLQAGAISKIVRQSLEQHIAFLSSQISTLTEQINQHIDNDPDMQEQRDLLISITGIGKSSASAFIAEVPDISRFDSAEQLAAYAGVTPLISQSGTSFRRQPHMSKIGNRRLRTLLFMPALSAKRFNPVLKSFVSRLEAKGKPRLVVIGAVMRKLLHIIFGVLKHKRPFDPNYLVNIQAAT